MNIAVILAGGIGSRVGAELPKQFIKVFNKPILVYTIEAFQNHPQIDAIEIVCVKDYIDGLNDMISEYHLTKVKWITEGGIDFQGSVLNGVNNLKGKVQDNDILLIHYSASPFISEEIITDAIKVCQEKGNCVSATPCYLLCGSNDDNQQSTEWVDRDKIMQLNSPQCFKFSYVDQLYQEAIKNQLLDKVEPHTTSLMYYMNRTIYFSKGDQTNIKITTQEDLELFKGYILLQKYKSGTLKEL